MQMLRLRRRRRLEVMLSRRQPVIAARWRMIAGHRLVELVRRTIGLGRGVTQAFGIGHRVTEAAQALVRDGWRRLGRFRARALDRLRLDLADRLLQRQPLARDVGFLERRLDAAQLVDQRAARALVQRTADFARVLVEAVNGACDQRMIISHWTSANSCFLSFFRTHVSNGFFIRIVSSRSGLVESRATGHPTSSSIRRTYFIACAESKNW